MMQEVERSDPMWFQIDIHCRNAMPSINTDILWRLNKAWKMDVADGYYVEIVTKDQIAFRGVYYTSTGLYLDTGSMYDLVYWLSDVVEMRMKDWMRQYNTGHWPYQGA